MEKKTFQFIVLFTVVFLLGFALASAIFYPLDKHQNKKNSLQTTQTLEQHPPTPAAEIPGDHSVQDLNTFLESLSSGEMLTFDQIYSDRQQYLQTLIASGTLDHLKEAPNEIIAARSSVESRLDFLEKLDIPAQAYMSVIQNLLAAYQILKETFDIEIEFIRNYPEKHNDISFITKNLFEISNRDEKSAIRYLRSLNHYRKFLAEGIRADETLQNNKNRMHQLITLNSVIEKYKSAFKDPLDNL